MKSVWAKQIAYIRVQWKICIGHGVPALAIWLKNLKLIGQKDNINFCNEQGGVGGGGVTQ